MKTVYKNVYKNDYKAMLKTGVLVTVLALPFSQHAWADEVIEQIELGLELYQEEEFGAAITELEFAIEDMRKMMSAQIAQTFPEAPDGWTAQEASSAGAGVVPLPCLGAGGPRLSVFISRTMVMAH